MLDHARGWAVLRHLAVPALAVAVVATLPMAGPSAPAASRPRRAGRR